MRTVALSLLLIVACSQAADADPYSAVSRIRASATCGGQHVLEPLRLTSPLERAAAAVASGGQLGPSVEKSGYRASRSTYVDVRGGSQQDRYALLGKKYCSQLTAAGFRDIGIFEKAGRLLIVLAAPFDPRVAGTPQQAMNKLLTQVNAARATPRECGAKHYVAAASLAWNDTLAQAARTHAENMAHLDFFSHTGRDGSTPAQRVAGAGYRYRLAGENIAGGQDTPEEAVASWIKSPGHCANLMNPAFTEMGAAYAVSKSSGLGVYWVQELGSPR